MKKFKSYCLQTLDKSNGGYQHRMQNKTLYLAKGGVELKLDGHEIKELLQTLGVTGDFWNGFKD
jgi:hypothetical protein